MSAALILKELRQHWLAFVLVAGLSGFGLLVLTASVALTGMAGSVLDALGLFLRTFFIITTLVICNRLVVVEYQSKTQLFLQSLPLSRLHMVLVKYLFGLVVLMGLVTCAFVFLVLLSARNEELTSQFVAMLAARSYAFSWCVYSGFFMMGLLGRYRVAIYLIVLLGFFAVESLTQLDVNRFGPFALLNDQFGYERSIWPTQALLVTMGLATSFIIITFSLSLVREGSVASLLAEKMSHREKVFVAVFVLGIMFALTVFDERTAKAPFDLPDAVTEQAGDVTVKVSLGASSDERRGRQLASLVATEVAALQEYLGIDELPPIFIVQRRDLDATRYDRGVLDGAEGLLVRANFLSDDWHDGRFLAWLVRELIVLASDGRVKFEPNMWVLDGFALDWTCNDTELTHVDQATLDLRAAYGMQQGFSADDVANWLTYRERVGEDIAAAVAWSGITSLRAAKGETACRRFLQTMLDCDVPGDARGVWHQWQHPLPNVMARVVGLPYREFVATWINQLEDRRQDRAADLASIPTINGTIRFESTSASTRIVAFDFTSDPPPAQRFTLIHVELPPFDDELSINELRRDEFRYEIDRSRELPGSYARGTRFGSTFAVWVEQLGCEIITGWTRREMR